MKSTSDNIRFKLTGHKTKKQRSLSDNKGWDASVKSATVKMVSVQTIATIVVKAFKIVSRQIVCDEYCYGAQGESVIEDESVNYYCNNTVTVRDCCLV